MPAPHILQIDTKDISGNLCIIGDVHGAPVFHELLDRMTLKDVYIFVGDLTDRGEYDEDTPTSKEVLEALIENEAKPIWQRKKIYVIRGNHELLFLSFFHTLRELSDEKRLEPPRKKMTIPPNSNESTQDLLDELIGYIGNGGAWVIKDKKLYDLARTYCFSPKGTDEEKEVRQQRLDLLTKELSMALHACDDPFDLMIPRLEVYDTYIRTLPYLIQIQDEKHPAWVVHADLPYTDRELEERIQSSTRFKSAEWQHLIWARRDDFSMARTNEDSVVYCGHSTIDEAYWLDGKKTVPIREETNHINLDVAAFFTQGFVVMNHTEQRAEVVTAPDIEQESLDYLNRVCEDVNHFLASRPSNQLRCG